MDSLKYCDITKMWYRDLKWANALGKMAPIDNIGLPQTFQFVKTVSAEHNRKWAIKWGIPMFF